MSENPNFEERLLNSYRDALFKLKDENEGPENVWGDLSQILLEAIGKNHELEKLKIELSCNRRKQRIWRFFGISTIFFCMFSRTGSLENQIQLEGAQIADLLNILQSNHSYQENLKLKDKISELEIDLEWYKEKDEYRNIEGAIEKLKLEGPEDKSDKKDDESEDSWTSWEDEEKSKSGDSFSDMDDIKGYGIFD
ncbi:Protein CBG26814 [Caenorhabditis briggsae]|uniref:Protein CBG26814 n=1 Tax=Caenorhabditis briggsae TaxID=6238 RepID=B6IJT3_CAEBR|nr:Protein CBG26814 [Caenorhabditis briggsae]CAS00163.1 Protein CBG26814 [Caenorhabditis briggsae]